VTFLLIDASPAIVLGFRSIAMKTFGYRVEDCARELKLSIPWTYEVIKEAGFPRPFAICGTVKLFDPKAVKAFAKKRKARRLC
jgi:predicted DNA-binding transcriptional regulator AlpA